MILRNVKLSGLKVNLLMGHKLLIPVITIVTLVSPSVRHLSHGVTQIPFECSKPPPSSETSVCLLPSASLCAPARSCEVHSPCPLWVWKLLRRQERSKRCTCRLDFSRLCDEQANARHSSLCSRLIACFSQTQRLVPLPMTPRRGWVCDEKGAENRINVIGI